MRNSKFYALACCLMLCFYNEAVAGAKTPKTTDADIMMVRLSSFQGCPNVTVDDMANAFFASPSWSVVTKKGFKYVNLKGKIIFNQKKVRVLLPFKITAPNDWSLDDLEMNDVAQIPLLRAGLLDKMCESAQPAAGPAPAEAPAAEAPAAEAPAAEAPAAEAPAAEAPPAEAPPKRKTRKSKVNKP